MNKPEGKIERWERGPDGFTAKANRQLGEIERRINRGPMSPAQVPPRMVGGVVTTLRVHAVHDNYLECKRELPDGTLDTAIINVAKYPEVRRDEYDQRRIVDPLDTDIELAFTYYDGHPQQRTVAKHEDGMSAINEQQAIVPRYLTAADEATGSTRDFLGSRVVAAKGSVTVESDTPSAASPDDVAVCAYVEIGPRAWAKTRAPAPEVP